MLPKRKMRFVDKLIFFSRKDCHLRPIYRDELMKFIINQYHSCHGDNVSFPTRYVGRGVSDRST